MDKRTLGNSGLEVAPLYLGTNVFGWTVDEAKSFELLDAFVDAGLNFIDTADVYSDWPPGNKGGESETVRFEAGTRGAGVVRASRLRSRVRPVSNSCKSWWSPRD